jgi:hypothetical protein
MYQEARRVIGYIRHDGGISDTFPRDSACCTVDLHDGAVRGTPARLAWRGLENVGAGLGLIVRHDKRLTHGNRSLCFAESRSGHVRAVATPRHGRE